jgi:hypothetical protein
MLKISTRKCTSTDPQIHSPAAKMRILVKQIWRTQKIETVERTPMTIAEHGHIFLENEPLPKLSS